MVVENWREMFQEFVLITKSQLDEFLQLIALIIYYIFVRHAEELWAMLKIVVSKWRVRGMNYIPIITADSFQ